MSRTLICGSFKHQEEDDELDSPCLTPPGRSRKTSPRKTNNKDSKNPFSTRGLDKFTALLADLEEKKQKIYSQEDSQNISLVRFVYSSSTNDVVPIVVKSKDYNKDQAKRQEDTNNQDKTTIGNKYPVESSADVKEICLEAEKKTKKINFSWKTNLGNLRHPSYYVPAAIILILVLLAVFGRSVAILFTSIGWYIVPTITGDTLKSKKKPRKKKDYVRRLSENKMVSDGLKKKEYVRNASEIKMVGDGIASPKKENNNGGAMKIESPCQHGHRKSW